MTDRMHVSQNVCKQGKYFGIFNLSKQIGQSKTLPTLSEAAIITRHRKLHGIPFPFYVILYTANLSRKVPYLYQTICLSRFYISTHGFQSDRGIRKEPSRNSKTCTFGTFGLDRVGSPIKHRMA